MGVADHDADALKLLTSRCPEVSTGRQRPGNIDPYLAAMPEAHREALQKIRKAVRAAAPEAEEAFV